MPIPPSPRRFCCPRCGWQQKVYPRSDVLQPGHDWFTCCPRCHYPTLEQKPLSVAEQLFGRLFRR